MSEAEFNRATSTYQLVRIRLKERFHGPGAPGDLAWVWVPAALITILFIYLIRRHR
jgi:hypothetical protein